MATAKVNDTVVEQPIKTPVDLWSVMRTVYILPEGFGETKKLYIKVNGIGDWYAVGEAIEVPEPIAQRVDIHNDAIRARQKLYASLRAETAKNSRYL